MAKIKAKTVAKKAVVKKLAVKKAVAKKTVTKPAKNAVAVKKAARPAAVAKPKAPVAAPASVPKDGCAPGSPWFIPNLIVRTAEAAIDFYQRAFGFTVDFTMPGPTGAIGYAQLRHKTGLLHLLPEGAYGSHCKAPISSGRDCPATLYVYCADVDAMVVEARAAGAVILSEPADMFWGDRVASLSDPEGYRWAFGTNIAGFDATRMPPSDDPHHGA